MRLILLSLLVGPIAASLLPSPQTIFTNPLSEEGWSIPTIHESAVQARRILRLETIGTLSTIFPSSSSIAPFERRPSDVQGTPVGLMDYFADCEAHGNPTILAIGIATSFKNVDAGSNITLSLRWHPPYPAGTPYSAASMPRFSLVGYLEDIEKDEMNKLGVEGCFVKTHPDAAAWLPGNRIHESKFVRLVVKEVYWIGGFGDRAYIGWIPLDEWSQVTEKEIGETRLPGEKNKWKWANFVGDW
ncbi:hypothetical protein EJ05DRAFT_505093 [Pseudovirgaria hyperparasitica]|uniref:CREG-like beta-barrel domain-containing protein n=1 Tax=Pseudovirgaria hyperparasitica TaxID=470096 RepID=A0A6A6VUQ0_9PEZI|nr:uncharacterized protein EJ05DRAFT_505093 [Pseudovirgaria hyperparasitica]KAF2753454.1 hypothetical protein EJ05DRAFT_505093 [Pseudovirgaria hyperparasitica]